MRIDDHGVLVDAKRSVIHLAYADTADVFIVINGGDKHLGVCLCIARRCRNGVNDGLKKIRHIRLGGVQVLGGPAVFSGGIEEGAIQLRVGGVQIHQKLQHFIDDLIRSCLRTVYLIDADDDRKVEPQSFLQYKFGLRHRTLKSVDHQDDAVDHFKDTFHLAAKIRMAGGVNDIDLDILIKNGRVFGEDGDAALSLDVIGVHDALLHLLVTPKDTALF